ncbi:HNH endonuclease [Micromonospora siamensis]|uniref:HNH endonuclease n=2 Tax=Micromonospora siamensis TaxID=299152 RepID=A0A1C5JPB8_9ACTN|nr:HNH endonuclease [Micromonospora siamensis]
MEELARADAALGSGLDAAVWALPEAELVDAVDAVHALGQRLAALQLALLREVDGRGTAVAQGASSTAVWLRDRLRLSVPAARRLLGLATRLHDGPPEIRAALADGRVDTAQAQVIAETVDVVRAEAGPEAADRATGLLVEWAGQFDPVVLRSLGTRILDHVAPEVADAAAARALEAETARAARDRHLTVSDLRDGRFRLTGSLDGETAGLLRAAIEPLTAPAGPDDARSPGQRRHDALAAVCRLALRTGGLPDHGGDAAQLVVTTSYDALTGRLGPGLLDTGATLTPETVRRLACDAAVLPAVLGGAGQVLDVGRQRRVVTGPLRRALVLRDRGCVFPGCDRPPRWCEGHHIRHWAEGGATTLTNSVLLCRHHHRQVHHHGWQVRLAPDGHPEFVPPAWLDPQQQPRRNHHRHAWAAAAPTNTTSALTFPGRPVRTVTATTAPTRTSRPRLVTAGRPPGQPTARSRPP